MKTPKSITHVLALAVAVTLAAGCGDDSNPVAPQAPEEEPAVEIKTPIKMRITRVTLWEFPGTKTDGDRWDYDPFTPINRNPDVYVQVGNSRSKTVENAIPALNTHVTWNSPGYVQMNYADDFDINLWDEDGGLAGADDFVAVCKMSPKDYYGNDNATGVGFILYGSRNTRLIVNATWVYPAE